MGQHWSHLTPTKRIQLDAFIRAGMKPTDIAKELGVHHTTIYRELKRCTYEHLNSDYTTETRYNPEGAQARYEANLRAKGPELKIGNDYELADYLIAKIRDEKYSPEAAIGEAEVKGWPFQDPHLREHRLQLHPRRDLRRRADRLHAAAAWPSATSRSARPDPCPASPPAGVSRIALSTSTTAAPSVTGRWTASRAAKASATPTS